MHLPWIKTLRNPVVFLLVIGERRLQLRIRIPHDCPTLGILPLLLQLMWPILLISLQHFSTISRCIPAGRGTAYVSSTVLTDLRPVASSSLGNYFSSQWLLRRLTTRAGSSHLLGTRLCSTNVLPTSPWDGWPIQTSSPRLV